MREMAREWEAESDPALRVAIAQQSIDVASALKASEGWQSVVSALDEEVSGLLEALARSSVEDEQNRGAIRALRHARSLPDRLIRAAGDEISRHRGT